MIPRLDELARRQHGVFTRAQALACGLGDDELLAARRRGDLRRLRHGCYTVHGVDDARTEHLRLCWAFVLSGGPMAAIAGASAAVAWELDLVAVPSVVHLVARHPRRARGTAVVRRASPTDEVVDVGGLPVATPLACVRDLADELPFDQAVVAVDSALRKQLVSPGELDSLARSERVRLAARRVARFADPRSESVGESLARVALDAAGLPAPDLQAELWGASGRRYRADFYWPAWKVIGEFDGKVKYTDPQVLWQEKRREDDLRAAGYTFGRFTMREVHQPRALAAVMRTAFSRAAA